MSEEINFDEVTTGATNDLEQATNLARAMVTRYGMSEKLGPRTFGKKEELVFLGREISEQRDYSDSVAQTIDEEVHDLIDDAYQTAKKVLTKNKDKLTQLAQHLIEHETAEGEALEGLLSSKPSEAQASPAKPCPARRSPVKPRKAKAPRAKTPPVAPSPAD